VVKQNKGENMDKFCDNPECINHKEYPCDSIRIKEHGSDTEKLIERFETVGRSGDIVNLCSSCRNAIIMVGGFIRYTSTTGK